MPVKKKKTIGRNDKADFPELGLENIEIKIDTGAYTSAIHCTRIRKKLVDGVEYITFNLLDPSHPQYHKKKFEFKEFKEKSIKSSTGSAEKRFIIKTTILLFKRKYKIELSLSERGEMRFPVLIGRKLLVRKFVVDPSLVSLSFSQKITEENIK